MRRPIAKQRKLKRTATITQPPQHRCVSDPSELI